MGIQRYRMPSAACFVALFAALLADAGEAATLVAGNATIAPGATGTVSLSIVGDGTSDAVQFDVEFDVGALGVPTLTGIGPGSCNYVSTPTAHIVVAAFDVGSNPLASQSLCSASFSVPGVTPQSSYPLTVTNIECSDNGSPGSCASSNGSVLVQIVLPDPIFSNSWDAGGSCSLAAWAVSGGT